MSDISALHSAMQGIHRGMRGLQRNAAEIASAERMGASEPTAMARPLVGMIENRLQVEASASAMRTVDETIGSLLDVEA